MRLTLEGSRHFYQGTSVWETAVYHSFLKFQYTQLGPCDVHEITFDLRADPETSQVNMDWYKERMGTSGSLRPSSHP